MRGITDHGSSFSKRSRSQIISKKIILRSSLLQIIPTPGIRNVMTLGIHLLNNPRFKPMPFPVSLYWFNKGSLISLNTTYSNNLESSIPVSLPLSLNQFSPPSAAHLHTKCKTEAHGSKWRMCLLIDTTDTEHACMMPIRCGSVEPVYGCCKTHNRYRWYLAPYSIFFVVIFPLLASVGSKMPFGL